MCGAVHCWLLWSDVSLAYQDVCNLHLRLCNTLEHASWVLPSVMALRTYSEVPVPAVSWCFKTGTNSCTYNVLTSRAAWLLVVTSAAPLCILSSIVSAVLCLLLITSVHLWGTCYSQLPIVSHHIHVVCVPPMCVRILHLRIPRWIWSYLSAYGLEGLNVRCCVPWWSCVGVSKLSSAVSSL